MDFNTETEFIKKYIKKEHQERLLFELQSPKKREKALFRFAHSSQEILKECFVKSMTIPDFKNLPFKVDFYEKCYIVSGGENDGVTLPLIDAIEFCKQSYMIVILITSKIVIVKEEHENKGACWFIAQA